MAAKGSVKNFSGAHLHIKARGATKAPMGPKVTPTGPKKVNTVPGNTKIKY